MEEQLNSNKSDLWNLSIKDLFYKYVRFLPLFLLSIAVALLIAFAYLRYSTRYYSASGSLQIKNDKPSQRNDKVEDLISGNSKASNIQTEIEVLKSRPLMKRVVEKLNLQYSYTAQGKIKSFNAYREAPFRLEAFEIADSAHGFSMAIKFINANTFTVNNEATHFAFDQVFKNSAGVFRMSRAGVPASGSEFVVDWRPSVVVASGLANSVKVLPKTAGTAILVISFETTNGTMAADVVNGLMVEYDSLTVEQNNYSNDQILLFINGRLNLLNSELDTLQLAYNKYKRDNNLIDVEKQTDSYLSRLKESDAGRVTQEFNLGQINEIERYLMDKENKYSRVTPSALTIEDVTLNELVSAYNKAQLERQSLLSSKVPPSNPAVKELEGQIEKLRVSVLESIKNIRQSYVVAIETLRKQGAVEESRLQSLPSKMKELIELERQINTKQALYSLLESKREEAAISRASTISNSTIIDEASPSTVPVKPNKRSIQIIAVLIGIGLPGILIFMSEVLNDKITTRFDIEKISTVPIMGEIGHSYADSVLIVNKASRSMVAEQFRIIRSNLQFVLSKNEKPVILVTSSFSGEGKSFISTNMGAVQALTGKKTIILEFDIRKPKVLSGLGMARSKGISNYLLGKSELPELILPVPDYENLYVLPCGPIPPNPSELLLDQKVADMFTWLKANFDVVVIDTAPVGMVSDAMTLGKFADCTLYLVRQGHTFKKQVALIDELYRDQKLPRVSIVINDVKVKPGYGYYGYGRYGYGYGYGAGKSENSYYLEEVAPPTAIERFLRRFSIKKKKKR